MLNTTIYDDNSLYGIEKVVKCENENIFRFADFN